MAKTTAYRRSGLTVPKTTTVLAGLCFCLAMVLFAICAHREVLLVPRVAGLFGAVAALAWAVAHSQRPLALVGWQGLPQVRYVYVLPAVALGMALAMLYRFSRHQELLPGHLGCFCLLAAAIGLAEEIAYRGFVQSCLRRYGIAAACIGAALAHSAYKCGLFILPAAAVHVNLSVLALTTVAVGIVFGLMREGLGSVIFPLAAHVAFDVVSYGDLHDAPWWV